MKNVNAALETISALGNQLNLDREQLSFLSISDFQKFETDSIVRADRVQLERRAAYNQKRWAAGVMMRLPDIIFSGEDVAAFRLEPWRANFITRKKLEARAVWLDEANARPALSGAIVVIRAADPGYDWIFAHNIAGLVTEYGGIASHMSIRAAEFGIPAAIGCGSVVFEALRGAARVELDCAGETVRPSC
jgi:phosphohistidine swiveling domain-containing protein